MWLELVRGRAPVGFPYMLALFTCSASTVFHVHCSVKPTSGFFFFWYTVTSSCVYCVCVVCACVVDAHQHFCCCFFVCFWNHTVHVMLRCTFVVAGFFTFDESLFMFSCVLVCLYLFIVPSHVPHTVYLNTRLRYCLTALLSR